MPPRSVRARLDDMLEATVGIRSMLEGMDLEIFLMNWPLQRATERGLEIISEASRGISQELKASEPDIPWLQIATIGNILRHEYQRVEPLIVWNIVESHLDSLQAAVLRMQQRAEEAEAP